MTGTNRCRTGSGAAPLGCCCCCCCCWCWTQPALYVRGEVNRHGEPGAYQNGPGTPGRLTSPCAAGRGERRGQVDGRRSGRGAVRAQPAGRMGQSQLPDPWQRAGIGRYLWVERGLGYPAWTYFLRSTACTARTPTKKRIGAAAPSGSTSSATARDFWRSCAPGSASRGSTSPEGWACKGPTKSQSAVVPRDAGNYLTKLPLAAPPTSAYRNGYPIRTVATYHIEDWAPHRTRRTTLGFLAVLGRSGTNIKRTS